MLDEEQNNCQRHNTEDIGSLPDYLSPAVFSLSSRSYKPQDKDVNIEENDRRSMENSQLRRLSNKPQASQKNDSINSINNIKTQKMVKKIK